MARQVSICTNVIDADTFDITGGTRIRLARVNGPPLNTPGAQKAKTLLESLILDKVITYEVLATDVYGRIVAEVWVDDTNVNDAVISAS